MIQYFLLGVLTVYIILPITDSVLAIVITLLEVIKGYFTLQIAKINHKMTQFEDSGFSTKNPIGFIINDDEEAEECDSEA